MMACQRPNFTEFDSLIVCHLPSHESLLLQGLQQLWFECSLCDLTLIAQGEEVYAHACVVSAFCPTLSEMLRRSKKQTEAVMQSCEAPEQETRNSTNLPLPVIDLNPSLNVSRSWHTLKLDIRREVLECILNALYTGVLRVTLDILDEFCAAIKWLQADSLFSVIFEQHAKQDKNSLSLFNIDKEKTFDHKEMDVSGILDKKCSSEGKEGPETLESRLSQHEVQRYENQSNEYNPKSTYGDQASLEFKLVECYIDLSPVDQCLNQKGYIAGRKLQDKKLTYETIKQKQSKRKRKSFIPQKISSTVNARRCLKKSQGNQGKETSLLDTGSEASKEIERGLKSSIVTAKRSKKSKKFLSEMSRVNSATSSESYLYHSIQTATNQSNFPALSGLALGSYPCDECGMEFTRKYHLTRHIRHSHEGGNHLICQLCSAESDRNDKNNSSDGNQANPVIIFKAKTETELRRHAFEKHGTNRPFLCQQKDCAFQTRRYETLLRHSEIHNELKLYMCDKCGQSFSQQAGLLSHQRACYQLQEYLCDLCGQGFNHLQSMKSHRRVVHMGEKPFKCSVCGNNFSDHRNLRRHMRIHNNSFPYECPACEQKFRHSNSLKAHIATKHKDMPPEQVQLPDLQPRNKLGGYSVKHRFKNIKKSSRKLASGETISTDGFMTIQPVSDLNEIGYEQSIVVHGAIKMDAVDMPVQMHQDTSSNPGSISKAIDHSPIDQMSVWQSAYQDHVSAKAPLLSTSAQQTTSSASVSYTGSGSSHPPLTKLPVLTTPGIHTIETEQHAGQYRIGLQPGMSFPTPHVALSLTSGFLPHTL